MGGGLDQDVYSRLRYLCIVLSWHLRILGAPSVKYCAPYRYLLLTVYLFIADIANPDLFEQNVPT